MTSPLGLASSADPIQAPRCQWLSEQDAHFHHARRFQSSPLAGYFKWTSKADSNHHDHAPPLFFASPPTGLGGLDQLHQGLNDLHHRNTNSVGSVVPGLGAGGLTPHHGLGGLGGGGVGGGGGLNYIKTTSSSGSLSGPPTPTNMHGGGANTPLVIPQPVKPMNGNSANINGSNGRPPDNINKTYQCKICDQIFASKSDMLIHCQQIHKQDPKPYKCSSCSKSFANSSCLSQHSRIHSGHKPYKCEICERKFTQLSHLQQHLRTHTGEKPYKCMHPGCGKAFSQLSSLQSHSRSHMTDKPFRCNSCYKCYSDEQSLREHIPKHTETKHLKTHICHICGKSYTQETYLTRHMAKHGHDSNLSKMLSTNRPIKQEPMDLVDRGDFIGASRLAAAAAAAVNDRSMTPSDLSIQTSNVPGPSSSPANGCNNSNNKCPGLSGGGGGASGGGGGGSGAAGGGGSSGGIPPSSAFMPLSPFGAGNVSSSAGPGYHYSPGLSHNGLGSPLPHISSMASPRYFPYDNFAFGRRPSDTPDRSLNMAGVQRESMIANSLLSLQHIKNYASQQMPSFNPAPTPGSRLAWSSLGMD